MIHSDKAPVSFRSRGFVFILVLAFCVSGPMQAQGLFKVNRLDKKGLRNGRWKSYSDKSRSIYYNKGRYRHDIKVGTWRYYTAEGKLERKEKFRKRATKMSITYYHPNGKVQSYGKAELVEEGDLLHYFWYGEWKFYTETGTYEKSKIFLMGKQINVIYPVVKP
jgi:antitoxin component YwqK of YwqJK toxin-antitoxin module